MSDAEFKPHHINATVADLEGNDGIGRYIFFPGSDARSQAISEHFSDVRVLESPRKHNLYLGTLQGEAGAAIDVAAISSGMGTPSLDIIMTELFKLGGKRFLRVGTAGSCQPHTLRVGNLVVGTAAVRDDNTSKLYLPAEFPAVASARFVQASIAAAEKLEWEGKTRYGIVHSKDSLYAREFGAGPLAKVSGDYMQLMEASGVLASDMESSHLFVLGSCKLSSDLLVVTSLLSRLLLQVSEVEGDVLGRLSSADDMAVAGLIAIVFGLRMRKVHVSTHLILTLD